jgi:predicted nucleic acid-binding protein
MLDNTVLTNFALVGRADLVFTLQGIVCGTTQAVTKEYAAGTTTRGLPTGAWQELQILILQPDESAFADRLPPQSGLGERTCIAVAVQRQTILATDDADARRKAKRHGVHLTGTLGLLALCIRQNVISLTAGNRLLADMIAQGYRSPLLCLDDLVSYL